MIEALSYVFIQKALLAGVLISLSCATIGLFLILRRLSLLGDGLAHVAFAGVAVSLLTGLEPFWSALAFASAGALGIQQLVERTKVYGDAATAVILSAGIGIAAVLIGLAKGFNVNLFSYLFGSILAISDTEMWTIGILSLAVLAYVAWNYKKLVLATFNEELAKVSGVNLTFLNTTFAVMTAITVVVGIRAVGILLVSALLVLPGVIALQVARSFRTAILIAVVVSIFAVVSGILLSFYLDLPPGGTIVTTLLAIFLPTVLQNKSR